MPVYEMNKHKMCRVCMCSCTCILSCHALWLRGYSMRLFMFVVVLPIRSAKCQEVLLFYCFTKPAMIQLSEIHDSANGNPFLKVIRTLKRQIINSGAREPRCKTEILLTFQNTFLAITRLFLLRFRQTWYAK